MKTLDITLKNLADARRADLGGGVVRAIGLWRKPRLEQVKAIWNTLPADRRAAAMQHLVDLGDDNFEVDFNAIFRMGLYDADPAVRAAAISGLWEDVDPALIAPLLNLLQTDDSEAVRAAAASVLGHYVYEGELEETRLTPK